MKEIIVATPKEEQFYEVVEFYGKDKRKYEFYKTEEDSVVHYDSLGCLSYDCIEWFEENMSTHEIITFEQWRELVAKKENVFSELTQNINLDIEILELARKLVIAGRIQDGSALSIIAGNSMKEKLNK